VSNRDLFGKSIRPEPLTNPHGLIRLQLREVEKRSTDKAVFLTMLGPEDGHHVGRSKVTRALGRDVGTWTMPRWLARENGWL
jgi:hypothetical protein